MIVADTLIGCGKILALSKLFAITLKYMFYCEKLRELRWQKTLLDCLYVSVHYAAENILYQVLKRINGLRYFVIFYVTLEDLHW